MIAYLEGNILSLEDDRLVLLSNQVGYEVMLPVSVSVELATKSVGDPISLHIYYHQTDRQPKPVLIGFRDAADKAFFQLFITVEAIGPMKAVKAMTRPIAEVAAAIENKDVGALTTLNGIGKRTAQKIVATLEGKVTHFAAMPEAGPNVTGLSAEARQQVHRVLVEQLGHRPGEARQLVADALKRQPDIATAEQLFDAIYLHEKAQ
jgi:Holliday junction DNA helicase RuvA